MRFPAVGVIHPLEAAREACGRGDAEHRVEHGPRFLQGPFGHGLGEIGALQRDVAFQRDHRGFPQRDLPDFAGRKRHAEAGAGQFFACDLDGRRNGTLLRQRLRVDHEQGGRRFHSFLRHGGTAGQNAEDGESGGSVHHWTDSASRSPWAARSCM